MNNKTKPNVLIILDSLDYKKKEEHLKKRIVDESNPAFYYTNYENGLIRFFHKTPVIGNLFSHLLYWSLSFVFAIKLLFKKDYEYKVFINPIVGIFYAMLCEIVRKKQKITVGGFLFEKKKSSLYFNLRKAFVNFSYKNICKIIVYSQNEAKLYANWFPLLASKFTFIPYGRDYDIFAKKEFNYGGNYIASGGGSNRDYTTLVDALSLLAERSQSIHCKIATRPDTYTLHTAAHNVEVRYDIRLDKFGSFLNNSLFVVIPLANTVLSAGHMALLEALYRKKVILITDIPSVRDYVDEDNVYFYKPGNVGDMAKKIENLYNSIHCEAVMQKAQRAHELYLSKYTFEALLVRVVQVSISN